MRRHKHSRRAETESSSNCESTDSSHRNSINRTRKVKYVRVEVSRREEAKRSDSSHHSSTPPPRKVRDVRAGLSKQQAAKCPDISDRSSTPLPRKAKDAGVSRTRAAEDPDSSDPSSPPTHRQAKEVGVGGSESTAAKDSDSSDTSSTLPARKAKDVGVGGSGSTAAEDPDKGDRNSTQPSESMDVNVRVSAGKAAESASSSARDSAPSPRNVNEVNVEGPGRKAAASTAKMASLNVSTPMVQITVHKPPPSLWSKLWSGLSWARASQVLWRDGALEGPKAPITEPSGPFVMSQGSSLPEDKPIKPGSPALQEECESSKSPVDSDVPSASSNVDTGEPAIKRRKVFTATDSNDRFEPAYSRYEPQRTARHVDAEAESYRQALLLASQTETSNAAVVRIAVNSYKHFRCRSYVLCKHLREVTNDIGLSIFSSYPEDQNLCLSLYGLSFIIALTERHLKDTKASLRETLRCGAMVPKDDGQMAYSCKEVVTTLRRRLEETDEVSVITETYHRPSTTVNQQAGYGIPCSTKNITNHHLTAEFETRIEAPTQGVWNEVLFNTACFENLWRCPFNKRSTYVGSFLNNWTEKVTVLVMRKTSILPYSFYPDRQVDVVCLPYADDALCMTLIVQRSSCGSLSVLTPDDVKGFVHGAREMLLTLHLPKFHVSTPIDVGDLMTQSVCANSKDQWMRFLHARLEASITVEEGSWPLTYTEHVLSTGDPVTIIVDRPFHFVITDRTSDLILCMGRVMSLA
ncbi:uncharacterized protein LOC144097051 [Amblyomma americanum]